MASGGNDNVVRIWDARTQSARLDFNGHETTYHYDSFARLVKIVRPGDTEALPTLTFEYQPADPLRGRGYGYDSIGKLTLVNIPQGSASRVLTRQREEAITRLRDLQYRELELAEQRRSLQEKLSRLDITAPVSGIVYDLRVQSLRSVIRPADPILPG